MAEIDVLSGIGEAPTMTMGSFAPGGPGANLSGQGIYDRSVEVLELPNFAGTQSMINPYVIFSLYDIGSGESGTYQYTKHFDIQSNSVNPKSDVILGTTSAPASAEAVSQGVFVANQNIANQQQARQTVGHAQDKLLRLTPTAANIIEYNRNVSTVFGYGPTPYSWADFLYCKYYGKIPNNHMVTLRRYPYPIGDNATSPNANATLPVAQAVTWFGEETGNKLSEIMKMTYGVLWKEIEAEVQKVDGNERPLGVGIESQAGTKAISAMGAVLTASRGSYDLWSGRQEKYQEWSKSAWENEGPYWNQIYGPVNVVHKSHMRDRGLKYENEIKLKFEYSLMSHGGVNPKVAMLDILANFLILTFTNAKFWGGATRYFPNASFRTGFLGDQKKFYAGDYSGYAKSVGAQIESSMKDLAAGFSKLMTGDFSGLIKTVTNLVLGNMSEKSMPNVLSIRSMLSGEPVGEWHLTVGNPLNPIAVMGNLIMTDTTISFGETLGADDFPTEMIFEVTLKPGKPRDKGDIESIFNNGYGRMSYAPITALASSKNTFEKKPQITDKQLYDSLAGTPGSGQENLSQDSAIQLIKTRVTNQWGPTFGDSANLLFLINSTKSRF